MGKRIRIQPYISRFLLIADGWLHPVRKKVVFNSFFGKQYSCNPRAVSEKMHEMYPDYELVWLLLDDSDPYGIIPDYVRVVKKGSRLFAWGREIASAAAYVYNIEQKTDSFRKRRQLFVQTWHGDRGIKRIFYADDPSGESFDVQDDRVTNFCVAGSDFGERLFRNSFRYHGEILNVGSPRNDVLLHDTGEHKLAIRRRLQLDEDVKVLLWAPTFRDNNKADQHVGLDIPKVLEALEERGGKWVCLVRAHVAADGFHQEEHASYVIDVTRYPDMADLLCIADMLITDYSSCVCDFSLTEKPAVVAMFDRQQYEEECRKFNFPPEEQGYATVYNEEQLLEVIRNTPDEEFARLDRKANAFYGVCETGHASEIVCRRIDEYYTRRKKK